MENRSERLARGAALSLLLVHVLALSYLPLLDPDEGRYSLIPLEMIRGGDFLTPRLNGVLYFEKPPLFYWLNAASIAVFGANPWGARFWSVALGLGTVALVWRMARVMAGRRAGVFAALVLATSPFHLVLSRLGTMDMTLTFLVTASLAAFWIAHREEGGGARAWYAAFAAAALAVMTKGFIGIVLPALIILPYLALTGRWSSLRRVPWIGGTALFLAMALPWHVAMAVRHPDWFRFYVIQEHLLRYLTPEAQRPGPLWYFLPILAVGFLPWLPLAPAVGKVFHGTAPAGQHRVPANVVFLLCWAVVIVGFFSLSQSKLVPYVLPAVPAIATLVGLGLDRVSGEVTPGGRTGPWLTAAATACGLLCAGGLIVLVFVGNPPPVGRTGHGPILAVAAVIAAAAGLVAGFLARRGRIDLAIAAVAGAGVIFFAGIWIAVPPFVAHRAAAHLAEVVHERLGPEDALYAYGFCPYTLAVALDRPIDVAGYIGELSFGVTHLDPETRARRFPSGPEFRARWESDRPTWVVLDKTGRELMQAADLSPGTTVLDDGNVTLVTNRPGLAETAPATDLGRGRRSGE